MDGVGRLNFSTPRYWSACLTSLLALLPAIGLADTDSGLRAAHPGDYEAAIGGEWRPLAEAGGAQAQFLLGLCYRLGNGVARDSKSAARWFEAAAAQDHVDAQSALGTMLLVGEGDLPTDYARAYDYLSAAATAGDRRAMYALGVLFEAGLGRSADIDAALGWYGKAADALLADAQVALGQLYYSGEVVERDLAKAVHWLKRAAEQGHGLGRLGIAVMLLHGEGVVQNSRAAYVWFGLAKQRLAAGDALGLASEGMVDAAQAFDASDRAGADARNHRLDAAARAGGTRALCSAMMRAEFGSELPVIVAASVSKRLLNVGGGLA